MSLISCDTCHHFTLPRAPLFSKTSASGCSVIYEYVLCLKFPVDSISFSFSSVNSGNFFEAAFLLIRINLSFQDFLEIPVYF